MAEPVVRRINSGSGVDHERIVAAVRTILEAIGEDPSRDGLVRTPERVAEMYEELFGGERGILPRFSMWCSTPATTR